MRLLRHHAYQGADKRAGIPQASVAVRSVPYLVTSPVSLVSIWSPWRPTTTCTR